MNTETEHIRKLADVITVVQKADLSATRRRDLVSAVTSVSKMLGSTPEWVEADVSTLRAKVHGLNIAAFGISDKTWSTRRSGFVAALELAGVVDGMGRGRALRDPVWSPLMKQVAEDKRLSNGLAAFANWCSGRNIAPEAVSDETVQEFLAWLESRTLHNKPKDLVCRVPRLWNEAAERVASWPSNRLTAISFRPPRTRLSWDELSQPLKLDVEGYLALRADPDIFDELPDAPRRPLAASTLRQLREHLRLAASILIENGNAVDEITSVADLVEPEHVKNVLRHYHNGANGKANAFTVSIAQTLIQAAKFYVRVPPEHLAELKRLASKLPQVPFDLTEKNKAVLIKLESPEVRVRLLCLPEDLLVEVNEDLQQGRLPHVKAQMAIAIGLLLVVPLRSKNLCELDWSCNFIEPEGPKGKLIVHIPAEKTKARRADYTAEVPEDVARCLRWYRRTILPRLNADPNGPVFVTKSGTRKSQETISQQITETIEKYVGIHMAPHTFRHLAASSYLEENPEDIETPRAVLGHSNVKTTLIYAGSDSRRSVRAYNKFLFKQRESLKTRRHSKKPKRVG